MIETNGTPLIVLLMEIHSLAGNASDCAFLKNAACSLRQSMLVKTC